MLPMPSLESPTAKSPYGVEFPVFYRLENIKKDTADIFTIQLSTQDNALPQFQPGQFNMIFVPGIGEVPISHSGDPKDAPLLTHTIREVGAVTASLAKLKKGSLVGLRGPFGQGWPMAKAKGKDIVIAAGGVGMAPLRPVIYEILKARDQFAEVTLLYGVKSESDFIFQKQWKSWEKSGIRILSIVGKSNPTSPRPVGHITKLIPQLTLKPSTVAFLCGPEIMMRFCAYELEKKGITAQQIFVSLERNMKCAIGFCGHCQFGPHFICKTGPVFPFETVESLMRIREL